MSMKFLIPLCTVALLAACGDRGKDANTPETTTVPDSTTTPAEAPPPSDTMPPAEAPPPADSAGQRNAAAAASN